MNGLQQEQVALPDQTLKFLGVEIPVGLFEEPAAIFIMTLSIIAVVAWGYFKYTGSGKS